MPRGSAYPGSPDDLADYRDLVDRHPDADVLGAKNPYTSRNGWMTSFLDPDGLVCLRLSPDDRAAVIESGGSAVQQYGRNMPDFASVPPGANDAELDELFATSWDHVGTLDPK